MVYCGKPSRGCQMCRTRRIKCDETKPTCKQCQKSRRQCPGYKDDFDLVFRNETQATERRAQKSVSHGKRIGTTMFQGGQIIFSSTPQEGVGVEQDTSPISPSDSGFLTPFKVSKALSIPLGQQASCFFLQNFVYIPRDPASRGWFDFLMPLIKVESPDSVLSVAFSAVAMASLANRPNSKGRGGLMPEAIVLYARALKKINLALQNPAEQKQDSTLASILLLGFFETVTSERSSVSAWGSHVDGAVQIVKMRGKKQLRTKTGQALFRCVRTQMVIHCMSASKSPLLGTDWWAIDSPDDPWAFTVKVLLRATKLRSEVNRYLTTYPRSPENFPKVLEFMRRAQVMEQESLEWSSSIPDSWHPQTVAWVDNVPGGDLTKADVCPGKVDVYRDVFIAVMWNYSRVARILLAGMIVRCAAWISSPVDYRTTPEYATSAMTGVDMISDIVASVPFHLGWRVDQDGQLKAGDLRGFSSGEDDITSSKALGGFFLMWPLFCAECSDYATDSQRLWIKGRLNLISDIMGMNQAKTIGNLQIRLPSMSIRRDNMGAASPSLQMAPQNTVIGTALTARPTHDVPPTTSDIYAEPRTSPSPPSAKVAYGLDPIQLRISMHREAFERERKLLLGKASNFGGESMERVIGEYLAI